MNLDVTPVIRHDDDEEWEYGVYPLVTFWVQ